MQFLLSFKVTQPENMDQKQLYELWMRESSEAPKIVKLEYVAKGPFKVAGKLEILTLIKSESLQELDNVFSRLPLIKELGRQVTIEILPLYPIPEFIHQLERTLR